MDDEPLNIDGFPPFKYELLRDFCFSCEKLGHLKYDCRNNVTEGVYGPTLRVSEQFCCCRRIAGANNDQITLKVKSFQDGNEVFCRIKRNTQIRKLMYAYCDRQSVEFGFFAFMFRGRRLQEKETPAELEMEDGEEIYAMRVLGGGPAA